MGYSVGVVLAFVRPSGIISQYLMVKFDTFLVKMISTMDSRYPIMLVKIDQETLVLRYTLDLL